ncbi:hypothetical protein [Ruminococcus sp.]|uniref:hypothetical protein n=1 Tax=Ruminococcus sp. TaxID=41978 RepID=UPI001B11580A|nr:hypothetical protein [Ruminococcus sp.]MBO5559554.1 hypothetical protein [Ruminococcus sp.]
MRANRMAVLLMTGAMVFSLFGCSQKNDSESGKDTASSGKETKAVPDKVELKNYKFPEFLKDIKQPDVLSSPVYVSFAESDYMTGIAEQPFEGYNCSAMIGNSLYVYEDGKFKGLLDTNGKVVLAADTYTSISPCSRGTLVLSRDKELNAPDDYMTFNGLGIVTLIDQPEFKQDKISVAQEVRSVKPEDDKHEESYNVQNLKISESEVVGEGTVYCDWDKVEAVSAQSINTLRPYSAYYRAEKNGEFYYICFDRFYNYTIYNGAYGYVRLKVGEGYGECYILDYDDYTELTKLIESFGETSSVKSPSKDESLDYIQLETGYGTEDVVSMTISADGYCLTDHTVTGEQQTNNKFFSILDKESFVSLVKWVDQVLSTEYVR